MWSWKITIPGVSCSAGMGRRWHSRAWAQLRGLQTCWEWSRRENSSRGLGTAVRAERRGRGEEPQGKQLCLPALLTPPLPTPLLHHFPPSLLPSLGQETVLGHSRTWKWPRQSREEPEESMGSPQGLHGHLKAGCAEQSNPPSLHLPLPCAEHLHLENKPAL